jgi:DNA-binding CsgD family transcriptional regulator
VLNPATKTVANYQAIIKRKLRVKNIAQLLRLAMAEGVDDQRALHRTEN